MSGLLLAGSLAMGLAAAVTPLVARAAARAGIVEPPDTRRVHRFPVPTAGGVGLFFAFWVAVAATSPDVQRWTGLLAGSTVLLFIGLCDDCFRLRPWQKLLGQVVAALVLVAGGTHIEFLTNPWGGMVAVGWWGVPLTVLWVVALINSLNFIDGLDGLAAGVGAIACIPLLIIAGQRGAWEVSLLTASLLGASGGFLVHNFNPARIFMGDSGAMFLGFVLAAISVEGALKGATAVALTIPLVILGLPVFDTACAVIRRCVNGRPIYEADAGHVHHRLLQVGLSHRRAVFTLYAVSGALGATSLLLLRLSPWTSLLLLGAVTAGLALWGNRLRIFTDSPTFAPLERPALSEGKEDRAPSLIEPPFVDSSVVKRMEG